MFDVCVQFSSFVLVNFYPPLNFLDWRAAFCRKASFFLSRVIFSSHFLIRLLFIFKKTEAFWGQIILYVHIINAQSWAVYVLMRHLVQQVILAISGGQRGKKFTSWWGFFWLKLRTLRLIRFLGAGSVWILSAHPFTFKQLVPGSVWVSVAAPLVALSVNQFSRGRHGRDFYILSGI